MTYTIRWKTNVLTVVIDTLHKESKPQKVITKEADCTWY